MAIQGALWAFASGLRLLDSVSQSGMSPRVVKRPAESIQNWRVAESPAKSAVCTGSIPMTNVLVGVCSADTCAQSVPVRSSSLEAATCAREAGSYQESATMPCWEGQAPVARVAMDELENVLARCRQ